MADELVKASGPIDALTPRERAAYRLSVDRKEPFLSPSLQDELYSLYQDGKTCEEIQALNKNLSLGMIVRARVDHEWDEKRAAYLKSMFDRAKGQAVQLSLESMGFLGDLLTAFHKHDRQKLQKFIQTGNPDELEGAMMTSASNLKLYRDVLELLLRLTGQGETKTQRVSGVVEHLHTTVPVVEAPLPKLPPAEPQTAAQILELVHQKRQQDDEN
jgi:hypothetical protein